jgi:hypothetical protein
MNPCSNCKNVLSENDKFCQHCGQKNEYNSEQVHENVPRRNSFLKNLKLWIPIASFLILISIVLINLDSMKAKAAEWRLISVDTLIFNPLVKSDKKYLEGEYEGDELVFVIENKGERKRDSKKVFVRSSVIFYDGKEVRDKERYYKYDVKKGLLLLGEKYEDSEYDWKEEGEVILPPSMKIGKNYKYTYKNERKIVIKALGFEDVKTEVKDFKSCLVLEYKFYDNGKVTTNEKVYLARGQGIIKVKIIEYSHKENPIEYTLEYVEN